MRHFSIKELERFSGIKAHTIRIWENRYVVFKPLRNTSNIRTYSLDDVKLLLNISQLLKEGMRISQIADMQLSQITERAKVLHAPEAMQHKAICELIICMYANEFYEFENILDKCVASFGIDKTIQEVILSFLERVELLSYKDSRAEVHVAVTAVRKKLIMGIEDKKTATTVKKTVLLFLPKGEHYDLLLLYMAYVLKGMGLQTLYLGTNLLAEDLQKISNEMKPDYLATYLPMDNPFGTTELAAYMKAQ